MFDLPTIIGFVLGILIISYITFIIIWRRYLSERLKPLLPPKSRINSKDMLPIETVKCLMDLHHTCPSTCPESARWANEVLSWLVDSLRCTPVFKENVAMKLFCSESVNNLRATRLGRFLEFVKFDSIELGKAVPQVSEIRTLIKPNDQNDRFTSLMALSMNISYDNGDSTVALRFETIFGVQIWMLVRIVSLKGPLILAIKDDICHLGFDQINDLSIITKLSIGGYSGFPLVNTIFGKLILPWLFKKRLLLPRMKHFNLTRHETTQI